MAIKGKNSMNWFFGDKGHLGLTFTEELKNQFIEIFTKVKKNMKEQIMNNAQKFYLSKSGVVETVIG
jgi:hypothetical protein